MTWLLNFQRLYHIKSANAEVVHMDFESDLISETQWHHVFQCYCLLGSRYSLCSRSFRVLLFLPTHSSVKPTCIMFILWFTMIIFSNWQTDVTIRFLLILEKFIIKICNLADTVQTARMKIGKSFVNTRDFQLSFHL